MTIFFFLMNKIFVSKFKNSNIYLSGFLMKETVFIFIEWEIVREQKSIATFCHMEM